MSRWPPRPRLARAFYKAHGLGNDYLVFEEGSGWTATEEQVRRVCDPHRGVGSDGIVALLADRTGGVARLRMFNPDGGEFEISGNGLRVLGSYLARRGETPPYRVEVGGRSVVLSGSGADPADVGGDGRYLLAVRLGPARIGPSAVGMDSGWLSGEGVLEGPGGEKLRVVPVSVGNPHLVVVTDDLGEERLARIGPFLTAHPGLAHGANVQLAAATGPRSCRALVWERGVGPTSASGTSACAVASALVSVGALRPGSVAVQMPGGTLAVEVGKALDLVLRGPVEPVCDGEIDPALVRD